MVYRKEFLIPTQYQWMDKLKKFLNHFYTKENRTSIRIYAVSQTMKGIYEQNGLVFLFNIFVCNTLDIYLMISDFIIT